MQNWALVIVFTSLFLLPCLCDTTINLVAFASSNEDRNAEQLESWFAIERGTYG